MPTIDDLPPASAAAATDEFMCSQGGIARKATLAQLLAPAQPLIALQPGQLLGRSDAPAGGAEPVNVGANLQLAGGVLSGAAPFLAATLPPAAAPQAADIVAMAQGGRNVGASYAAFMAGISSISGISAGAMQVRPNGATASRTLGALLADAVTAEDFGAVGDGVTDDTAALAAALASGQPVRLGAKTYVTSGQWTISGASATLLGVPGQTTLRRLRQANGGAWISVQSTAFYADGVTFDANSTLTADVWGVLVTPSCLGADFHRCAFANARGPNLGSGLVFQAADPAPTQHAVRDCAAYGNAVHGVWVQALQGVLIEAVRAHANGQYGICLDYADPALVQKLRSCQVLGCVAWSNQRGISVGNYNATNTTPPVWGNANPDALDILVSGNICHDNGVYGIAVSGQALNVCGNLLANNGIPGGAGLLANASFSRICGNVIAGGSAYGIDAGGSQNLDVCANHISGAVQGINCGGGQNVNVTANTIDGCTYWAVLVNNVETDGHGLNFGMACNGLAITDNWIGVNGTAAGGILLLDNPQNVLVSRNCAVGANGATPGQALWPNSASVSVAGNTWNYAPEAAVTLNGGTIAFPDLLDRANVTGSGTVNAVLSSRQQALAGQIGFIALTSGGAGYTTASVQITGDGQGAAAIAYVSNGAVIGIALTSPGSAYSHATVSITGDGNGATAAAQIGLPVPQARRIAIHAAASLAFSSAAAANWTGATATLPPGSAATLYGAGGSWMLETVALSDYLQPGSQGTLTLTTQSNGDLVLRPNGTGHLRLASAAEATGITSSIGRGSPSGVVSAPPGSDYRNLNGGAGSTYWVKQTGTGNTGWVAIA